MCCRVVFCFLLALSVLPGRAAPKMLSWSLEGIRVEGRGDSLAVTLDWSINDWNISPSRAVVFSPVLKNRDRMVSLTPVAVYGRKAAQQVDRRLASGSEDEYSVVDVSSPLRFSTEDVFPYQEWMDTVRVILSVSDWSRGSGLVLMATSQKGEYIRPEEPEPFVFPIYLAEPMDDNLLFRDLTISAPVHFSGKSVKYDPDFAENDEGMEEFRRKVKALSSTRDYAVRSSSLVLTVPPEGKAKESVKLSRNRVSSVYSYLYRQGLFRIVQPSRIGGGEDWDGALRWVAESRYSGDDEAVAILSRDTSGDAKAQRLRVEKPVLWDILKTDCFPTLGKVEYNVSFKSLSFSSAEAMFPYFESMPEALSPKDFWFLSGEYSFGTPQWLDVMRTGADLYPECPELNLDVFYGLMDAKEFNAAAMYLRNVGVDSRALYATAYWFYWMGRYDECLDILSRLQFKELKYGDIYDRALPYIKWHTNRIRWVKWNP